MAVKRRSPGKGPQKLAAGPHLRSVALRPGTYPDRFPFSTPVVRLLRPLDFDQPVTFFVGENGSGKSTLLEGIATASDLATVGSVDRRADQTLSAQRELARALSLTWAVKRMSRGFFLRAEDFFGFTKTLAQQRAELLAELESVEAEYASASEYARGLRKGPIINSLTDMERRYGVDLDAQSHGESFLALFRDRFVPGGLYLLDEPEAPLSPQSQLALLAMLREMVQQDAQFIIATHSPMLLAYPGATIYEFSDGAVTRAAYASLDHVAITRSFLADPERYLRQLFRPPLDD